MSGVEGLGDREVDHRVAEVLEALVVAAGTVAMLVVPARVDERLLEQVQVADGDAETFREALLRVARGPPSGRDPAGSR